MAPPKNVEEWKVILRGRCARQNRELGIDSEHAVEVFRVTAWGEVPELETLQRDFPALLAGASPLKALGQKLTRWRLLG
jgi:hypothetical protein